MLRNTPLDVPLETESTKADNLSSNMENLHSTNSLKMNALSSSMSEMSQTFNENTVLNTMHRDENNLIKNKGIVSSMKSYQQNTHSSSMAKNNDNTNNIAVPFSLSDVRCFGRISLKNSHLTSLKSDNNNEKENNLTINNTFMEGNTANVFNNFGNAEINSAHGSAEGSEVDIRENSQSHKVYEADVRDGLGPLPPKWETAYTERGELYFIDHNTGTSHWLDPRLSRFQKKSLEDCTEDELPYGWEKIEDSLYGTYYIDHVNRKTQYENPVLEAKRRAAERTKKNMHEQMEGNSATPLTTSSVLTGVASSSTASTVDIAQRNMHPPPPLNAYHKLYHPAYKFTRNPSEMRGERITTTLIKSFRGLGIKIVGGESLDGLEEFLQIKSIVPQGPAWQDNKLKPGDILVYVNDTCVLGLTHLEMVNIFQSIMPGDSVTLEISRGYPLPFDPNDPNTEVVTTIAVDSISSESANIHRTKSDHLNSMNKKIEAYNITINKGVMGFGFTIADSAEGQKVKKILDRNCCAQLQEGDILLQINETDVRFKTHNEVVRTLKECSNTEPAILKIQRNINDNDSIINEYSGDKFAYNFRELNTNVPSVTGLYRSKTPTADLYSTQQKEILPIRPKTPLVDTRRPRVNTPSNELSEDAEVAATIRNGNTVNLESNSDKMKSHVDRKSINSLDDIDVNNQYIPFMDPYPKLVSSLTERLANSKLQESSLSSVRGRFSNDLRNDSGHTAVYDVSKFPSTINAIGTINPQSLANHNFLNKPAISSYQRHHNDCFCYSCQDEQTAKNCNIPLIQQMPQRLFYGRNEFSSAGVNINQTHVQSPQYTSTSSVLQETQKRNDDMQKRVNDLLNDRKPVDFSTLENQNHHLHAYNPIEIQSGIPLQQLSPAISSVSQQPSINWRLSPNNNNLDIPHNTDQYELNEVTLERQSLGFGFRIVGGTEEGSQVAVGHIVPGGSADKHPHINTGDEILSIDGINVVNSSHHKVVSLMGEASLRGKVTMIVRRRIQEPYLTQTIPSASSIIQYPYDVIVSRHEHEGFGFVIISSSSQFYGSTIGKLIPESPADRCGTLKVGDRIVAVNCIEIAGMSHGDVVNLIKESGLHVRLTIGCPIKEFATGSNSQEGTKSPSSLISTEQLQSNSHALPQLSQPKRDFPTSNNCATRNTLGDHQQKS